MEKNIFEGAKFGDKFLCRNGKIALYLHQCTKVLGMEWGHHLTIYTDADAYANNGKLWSMKDSKEETEFDIVSRYQEPIDENKLDKLALEYVNKQWSTDYKSLSEIIDDLDQCAIEDFKAGYKKAKEE